MSTDKNARPDKNKEPRLRPRASYIVKPPRVFVKSNHYYLRYYLSGNPKVFERATGIPAITDATESKERKIIEARLQDAVDRVVEMRARARMGDRYEAPARPNRITYEALLESFNHENAVRRGGARKPSTLRHRRNAVDALLHASPGVEPMSAQERDVLALRNSKRSPASLRGYLVELRALQRYAMEKGYASDNPFARITVRVPEREMLRFSQSDEYKLYRFLWIANRANPNLTPGWKILKAVLGERLTLLRIQDVCNLKNSAFDFEQHEMVYHNAKRGADELFPLSDAFERVAHWPSDSNWFSHFRSAKTVNDYLTRACAFAGVPRITTHDLKRLAAHELDALAPPDRVMTLALHHTPIGETKTMQGHYARNREPLRDYLNRAQRHFLDLFDSFEHLPPDTTEYHFSNPSKNSRRKTGAKKNRQRKTGDSGLILEPPTGLEPVTC